MTKKVLFNALAVFLISSFFSDAGAQPEGLYSAEPLSRRGALMQAAREGEKALPYLGAALYDESPVVRVTAIRMLIRIGDPSKDLIRAALLNSNPDIRRTSLLGLEDIGALDVEDLAIAIKDSDDTVRLEAARLLSKFESADDRIKELLKPAVMDKSFHVREVALRAVAREAFSPGTTFCLRRENLDVTIHNVRSFQLPEEGWRFSLDKEIIGHLEGWHKTDYLDNDWDVINIRKTWDAFGYEHTGIAWYRASFDMPEKTAVHGLEMFFGAINDSAWIWINGLYAGGKDIGSTGREISFGVDFTELVRWGERNYVAIRIMNTSGSGGISKPITVNFLRARTHGFN